MKMEEHPFLYMNEWANHANCLQWELQDHMVESVYIYIYI